MQRNSAKSRKSPKEINYTENIAADCKGGCQKFKFKEINQMPKTIQNQMQQSQKGSKS